jgi:hypothetical protein
MPHSLYGSSQLRGYVDDIYNYMTKKTNDVIYLTTNVKQTEIVNP